MRIEHQARRAAVLALCLILPVATWVSDEPAAFELAHPWLGDGSAPIAISHEGVRDDPDGPITTEGFVAARELGFTYMETDLRLVGERLVALHDVDGEVDMAAAAAAPDAETLLTSPDLVDVRWNFELKGGTETTAEKLGDIVAATGSYDRVCVSFGINIRVKKIRDALPPGTCMCATLLERAADWDILGGVLDSVDLDSRVVCTQMASEPFLGSSVIQVGPRDVRRAHDRGLAIHVYDVLGLETSEADIERWLDMGVDGIITDDHEELRQVFEDRGIWPPSETP